MRQQLIFSMALALVSFRLLGQTPSFEKQIPGGDQKEELPSAVRYLYPEQLSLPAGKQSLVSLHFSVAQGLHINSHVPKDEFLIPTTLSIPDGMGVKLDSAEYPQGTEFALPVEPRSKLVVYTGDFVIQARITADPGDHLVRARLRYQACDQNACLPPKTITVPIDVVGK